MKRKVAVAILIAVFLFPFSAFLTTSLATPDDCELLIIAPEEFMDALHRLEEFKNATNRPTILISLESVYSNPDFDGADEAEEVKKCIAYCESTYGIKYVMLVGDCDKFPMRTFYYRTENTTHIKWSFFLMTDHYYADLYNETGGFCDWDYNQNGLYGEASVIPPTYDFENRDHVDFNLDVAVGRVPASNVIEVNTYVDKIIQYEVMTSPDSWWFKRALLLTGAGGGRWPAGDITQNEDIASKLAPLGFDIIRLYDETGYVSPTPARINEKLNDGVGIVNAICHADIINWGGCYDVTTNMTGLDNTEMLPVVYSVGCHAGQFGPMPPANPYIQINGEFQPIIPYKKVPKEDFVEPPKPNPLQDNDTDIESMAEYWTVKHEAGAVAFIGSTGPGHPYLGPEMDDYFFDAFAEGKRILGDMWLRLGEKYLATNDPWHDREHFRRWIYMNLFGDPSLTVGGLIDKPPTSIKTVGVPCYEDAFVYVTSSTPHTLTAVDDSAISASYYRYYPEDSTPPSYELYLDPFVIEGDDGPYVVEYYSIDDGDSWDFPIKSQVENLDNTPPTITINSPIAGDYLHSESITLDFFATDGAGSGVALVSAMLDGSPVSDGDTVDLSALTLDGHTLIITAVDNLGHTTTASVTFDVIANVDSLIALVERFYANGQIDDPEVRDGLLDKLYAAKALIDANKIKPARNILRAFINQVEAQLGHHITEEEANILLTDVEYTIDHL